MTRPARRLAAGVAACVLLAMAPAPAQDVPDLPAMTGRLAEQARNLAEDVATNLGGLPGGANLAGDARELAQAAAELDASARATRDSFAARRAFSGFDGSWRQLRAELAGPSQTSAAVARSSRRVDEADEALARALDQDPLPATYYGNAPPPAGRADAFRLARSLDDRAAALAAAARSGMIGMPDGTRVLRDVDDLARACDAYADILNDPGAGPDAVAGRFAPINPLVDRVDADLRNLGATPAVASAWRSFSPVVGLIRQNLGYTSPGQVVAPAPGGVAPPFPGTGAAPPPLPAGALAPPVPAGAQLPAFLPPPQGNGAFGYRPGAAPPQLPALAGQLLEQSDAFLRVFAGTSFQVPERGAFLVDATRLRDAAADFRRDAASNLDAGRLAFEFRDVDACWQRLARRTARIARGRTGPNINQVAVIGQTCSQIHDLLGIPGYAPDLPAGLFVQP